MLLSGLVFFWCIFDFRPALTGIRYGVRLMMLWITILSNIILGSYLTLKKPVLYTAYAEFSRVWDFSQLEDEQLGGMLIWNPSSMMGLVAVLIVIHMLGRHETREEQHRTMRLMQQGYGRNEPPMTGADLIQAAAGKNRAMALGFTGFVTAVFAATIAIGVISKAMGTS